MGGFDIYVAVNASYLNPTNATLGPLIASPSLTNICIDGSAQTGACTTGTVNGPGVVEASTVESSGTNECSNAPPCSGLAFNITYMVVGPTASTPIFYPADGAGCSPSSVATPTDVCVLVPDALGNTLPENIQGARVTQGVTVNPTSTALSCNSPDTVGMSTKCTATVTDTATSGATNPTGQVTVSTSGSGGFSPSACTLSSIGTNQAACFTSYTPTSVGTGNHNIGASYPGDTVHTGSTATSFSLTISPASPIVSTMVILETTGSPVTTNVPVGSSVHETAVLIGGYPATRVSGTVTDTTASPTTPSGTVSFGTNSTGTFTSIMSCTLAAGTTTGTASCTVTYTPTVTGHHLITSSYGGDSTHATSAYTLNMPVVIHTTTAPASTILGLSPAIVYSIIEAIVVVATAMIAFLALGRRSKTLQQSSPVSTAS